MSVGGWQSQTGLRFGSDHTFHARRFERWCNVNWAITVHYMTWQLKCRNFAFCGSLLQSLNVVDENCRSIWFALPYVVTLGTCRYLHFSSRFCGNIINAMLLLTESAVHTRKYLLWRHAVRTERSEVLAAWRHNKYFPYGPTSRLIRASLYTDTSKTTKSQCFSLL